MKEATFSVSIVRDIIQFAATYGAEPASICAAIGIEPALLEVPDQHVPGAVLRQLWREVVERTGDADFGLHIGEAFNVAAIGIVGYVLVNCKTFAQVLEKLCRYTQIYSHGVQLHVSSGEGVVWCDCDVVEHLNNFLLDEPRQVIESVFASLMTATKRLTGNSLQPHAVWFQHADPGDSREHQRIFQTRVRFAQPVNRVLFGADCLEWPVLSANPSLLSVFEQHAEAMLNPLLPPHSYANRVVAAIAEQLKGEVPSIEAIARRLILSVRQLQRELQNEGTSYQQLLDDTRRELALRQLKQPQTSIADVAFWLGFSDASAFHRAFKRWTGQTPRAYKLRHHPSRH